MFVSFLVNDLRLWFCDAKAMIYRKILQIVIFWASLYNILQVRNTFLCVVILVCMCVGMCLHPYQIYPTYSHMWITPVSTLKFSHVHQNFNMQVRLKLCPIWRLKNFTPENVRPEMYIPKTGLKIFTPTQAWKLSHLKQVWTFSWKIEKWIYLLRHVPSQTIYTWRPSFAIPHIFYTGNKSS